MKLPSGVLGETRACGTGTRDELVNGTSRGRVEGPIETSMDDSRESRLLPLRKLLALCADNVRQVILTGEIIYPIDAVESWRVIWASSKCTWARFRGGAKSARRLGIECSAVEVEGDPVMKVLPGRLCTSSKG